LELLSCGRYYVPSNIVTNS